MSTWPTGWREHALRRAEVPITDFAMDVLNLWEKATPTERYTNNPLGIPAHAYGMPRALNGNYSQFPTMQAFYDAFKIAVHSRESKPLLSALAANDRHSVAWRAINTLNWPANDTETDYPATLLDRITEKLPKHFKVSKPEDRKTVGVEGNTDAKLRTAAIQAAALHHSAHTIIDGTRAIEYIVRRMNQNG